MAFAVIIPGKRIYTIYSRTMQDKIVIKNAREHNLKGINITIPRDRITVITGPSGSGKSSLAMDTIYAEGQRRYVESLSPYARQFLEQMHKPEVDLIEGLSPAIAIDQKSVSRSPRSTVGTVTEIYDYMRVLFTRIGVPVCYKCGAGISSQDIQKIIDSVISLPHGSRIQVLAQIARDRKGEYKKELLRMRADGFVRARIDGKMIDLTQDFKINKQKRHTIEIVIDRFIIKSSIQRQIADAIDTALRYSDTIVVNMVDEDNDMLFSRAMACPKCGISYPEIDPRLFSFNSKIGACPVCKGLGYEGIEADVDEVFENDFSTLLPCHACSGSRLSKEALSIKINDKNIAQIAEMPVLDAHKFLLSLNLTDREKLISKRILKEILDRLAFLDKVGLGYLALNRSSITLSGGEAQRIRLASQLGSALTGVLYVLDEPSIGLHPADCSRLLDSLAQIRDSGNTVIIVEHDEDTILSADHVVDMGPGAGANGGWVTSQGSPQDLMKDPASLTGRYLSRELRIPMPVSRRKKSGTLSIRGASLFNLKNMDVDFPLGTLTCITGLSGSGKSTLIMDILYKTLLQTINGSHYKTEGLKSISGYESIDKVICVDQSPLGRTPRSNPATYSGIFSFIRELFAGLPESRVRGYTASRFSFNLHGGRCESCKGDGLKKVEMHFLPDIYVECDKCRGKRYNNETLQILYKDKNISEVLEMTASEALNFFSAVPQLRKKLEVMEETGLGYIKIGQSATTLSGGEAQRLRLSRELSKRSTGRTLYIFDEPTTGLHFIDIQKLLNVFDKLVNAGNTVIVIEHDFDIIKCADHIIDLGPGSGECGGRVVAAGTPEEISLSTESHTGAFLLKRLKNN
ncbi:MAG: excinuclease ABC subunit UvrA [Dissulfurispiraceae bacterium]|jgi:excinuclease ABC subunit A|nr:excinuclease ABC subunit UvrA [Dissulfurispiraceae bacterium]